jgi:putative hemolysin
MIELSVIVFCLILNGIFAAIEMAFVTVTKARLRELARTGNSDAQRILELRDNPERTLSIIQIGITVVGAIAAAVGGVGAVSSWAPWLQSNWEMDKWLAQGLAVVLVVFPLTYLNVVIGELVPKTLALKNPLGVVMLSARWLRIADRALSPVVSLFEASTRIVIGMMRPLSLVLKKEEPTTAPPVELDELSKQTREYVLNLVDLEHKRICDVKLPWEEVIAVRRTDSIEEVEKAVLSSGHTRLPVLAETEVAGIINTKEFMVLRATGVEAWQSLIRPVIRVDENWPILKALRRMQIERSHLSIAYRDGRRTGIVTVEDIIEEIIGDLFDEDDDGRFKRVLATSAKFRSYAAPAPRPQSNAQSTLQ